MVSCKLQAVCLVIVFLSSAARAQDSSAISSLLANPVLAPLIQQLTSNPALFAQLSQGALLQGLIADPAALAELASSSSFQTILSDPSAVQQILTSPKLAALNYAPAPVVSAEIVALLAASKAPSSGNAQIDMQHLVLALGLAPAPAPENASARKLLQNA